MDDVDWTAVANFFADVMEKGQPIKVTVTSHAIDKEMDVVIPGFLAAEFMKHLPSFKADVHEIKERF